MSGPEQETDGRLVLIATQSDLTRGFLEALLDARSWRLRQVYNVYQADCALQQDEVERAVLVIDAALLGGQSDGAWQRLLAARADLNCVRIRESSDGEAAGRDGPDHSSALALDKADTGAVLHAVSRALAEA